MNKLKKLNAWSNDGKFHSPKSAQGFLESRGAGKPADGEGKASAQKPAGVSCGVACSSSEDK